MQGERDYYSVEEAAAVLGTTPARVLQRLTAGELEGLPPGATAEGVWKVLLPVARGLDPAPDQAPPAEEPLEDLDRSPEPLVETTDAAEEDLEAAVGEDLPRGDDAATTREPTAPSGWVSTQQAARALSISPRTVRWHIEQGNLEAKPEGEGVKRTWLVSIDSLQEFRDARQTTGIQPRTIRTSDQAGDIAAEGTGSAIRELADRLAEEAARAAEFRVRLEISEKAQSTLEEELSEERRRREEAEQERDDLRRKLDEWRQLDESAETTAHEIHDRLAAKRGREETPTEAPEARVTPSEPVPNTEAPPEAERVPWWRRMIGG